MKNTTASKRVYQQHKRESYVAKFIEGYLSISIFVGIENSLVNNLLKLFVTEVTANHGLQYLHIMMKKKSCPLSTSKSISLHNALLNSQTFHQLTSRVFEVTPVKVCLKPLGFKIVGCVQ